MPGIFLLLVCRLHTSVRFSLPSWKRGYETEREKRGRLSNA